MRPRFRALTNRTADPRAVQKSRCDSDDSLFPFGFAGFDVPFDLSGTGIGFYENIAEVPLYLVYRITLHDRIPADLGDLFLGLGCRSDGEIGVNELLNRKNTLAFRFGGRGFGFAHRLRGRLDRRRHRSGRRCRGYQRRIRGNWSLFF